MVDLFNVGLAQENWDLSVRKANKAGQMKDDDPRYEDILNAITRELEEMDVRSVRHLGRNDSLAGERGRISLTSAVLEALTLKPVKRQRASRR
jgi:hypothetical protein